MAFEYVLANLLANTDRAVGVMFMDETGETVDMACSEFTPYQMRVVGAYLGIYLRQLERLLERGQLGGPKMVHIEKDSLHIHALPLPDGYYLVLVQRAPGPVAQARTTLVEAGVQLKREVFGVS